MAWLKQAFSCPWSEEIFAGDGADQRVASRLQHEARPDEALPFDVAIRLELLDQRAGLAFERSDVHHEGFLLDGAPRLHGERGWRTVIFHVVGLASGGRTLMRRQCMPAIASRSTGGQIPIFFDAAAMSSATLAAIVGCALPYIMPRTPTAPCETIKPMIQSQVVMSLTSEKTAPEARRDETGRRRRRASGSGVGAAKRTPVSSKRGVWPSICRPRSAAFPWPSFRLRCDIDALCRAMVQAFRSRAW